MINPPLPSPAGTRARLNTRAAMLVALAMFAQGSVLDFYDSQVPASIAEYTTSAALIGLLMGLDNLLGIVIQPVMGHLSDRTRTRWGRRIPYLVVGTPLAAIAFVLIPHAGSLGALIACIFVFAVIANVLEPITDTLTPDFQPAGRRSLANGIVKVASSLTIISSALISLFVVDENLELAFAIPAVMMVAAVVIVALTIHESKSPGYQRAVAEQDEDGTVRWSVRRVIGELMRDRDRSRIFLLLSILAMAGTWSAMRSQLTPYAMEVLDLTRGQAGALVLPAGVAFIVVAIPIAHFSDRLGRRRIVRAGIVVMTVGCLVAFSAPTLPVTLTGVILASVGYAAFAINAVVLMWNLAPSESVTGAYTGIYAVAMAVGGAAGPALVGAFVDVSSWRFLFLITAVLALVTFALFMLVRREISPSQAAEEAHS